MFFPCYIVALCPSSTLDKYAVHTTWYDPSLVIYVWLCSLFYLLVFSLVSSFPPVIVLTPSVFSLDPLVGHVPPPNPTPVVTPQADVGVPATSQLISSRRRPARTPGLAGTNASFLVPDNIRKKFIEGWVVHVPLTYLTDKGCLFKDKSVASSSQSVLTIDEVTGQIQSTPKSLLDEGELDLTFDEWHQAWRRLLDLISTYLPQELQC